MAVVGNTTILYNTHLPLHLSTHLLNSNYNQLIHHQKHKSHTVTTPKASLSFSSTSVKHRVLVPKRRDASPESSLFQEINNLCSEGSLNDALLLLRHNIEHLDYNSTVDVVGLLLQASGTNGDLEVGRKLHDIISSSEELLGNVVLTTRLLTMYSMCGCVSASRRVFDELGEKNLYQWNAMISGYARNEMWEEAVDVFCRLMSTTKLRPDNFTLPCVFKSCAGISDVGFGKLVHGNAVKLGLGTDTFVGNSLISMYGKCGNVDEAVHAFETMPERNLVSWNTMMSVFSDNGLLQKGIDLFKEMLLVGVGEGGIGPDDATMVTVLPMCTGEGWLGMGRLMHGLSVKLDLDHLLRVNNALIDMYAKCGDLVDAECLFSEGLQRNVVSWNAMLGGYARNGDVAGTFALLHDMQMVEGLKANEVTILNVLPVCLGGSELQKLKELHCFVIRNDLQINDLVSNALIAAYAKCGSLESAGHVFNGTEIKTVSLWNALIGGHAQNGDSSKAIELFLQMSASGLAPDWFSIGSLLLACANLKHLQHGKTVHGFAIRNGLEKDSFIGISLLSLYIQCGRDYSARLVFDAMEEKDMVSWNAMIAGYSQNGLSEEALSLFRQMQLNGCKPSMIATTSALMSCTQLSAVRLGKETHCFALKASCSEDAFVGSSIIDMYAKTGFIEQARIFFDRMKNKDAVPWNVMLTGYGINGSGNEAINLYNEMQREGIKPDGFTYVGLLMACSHSGMVEEGLNYFEEMKNTHELEPKLEHYACLVDMLGRAGRLADAAAVIEEMPEDPDGRIWSALLCACRLHGDMSLGEKVAEKLLELEPDKSEHYILASNLYAGSGRWDDVRRIRKRLKETGLYKDPGCSWTDVDSKVYSFIAGDNRLPESSEVKRMWCSLEEKIRAIGYIPDTASVLHDLEEDEKVELLRCHSEKQAIAFVLLRNSKATKLRVYKNIRMCRDCHNAIKLVSRVVEKEIVVRDNKRFHHFREGFCSCGNYW
ncbi:pentatricopeptide repeat-containing protein At1g18485 [Typha angustifolia]|uniref:pentatricopeptide repeat-containing protein At1g18485 n=1 Tax=Typha angustifolia TaxID=59011 RepID=UPI003C2E9BBC